MIHTSHILTVRPFVLYVSIFKSTYWWVYNSTWNVIQDAQVYKMGIMWATDTLS